MTELPLILKVAKELKVEPWWAGPSSAPGAGKWNPAPHHAKFGLTAGDPEAVEVMEKRGMLEASGSFTSIWAADPQRRVKSA